MSLHGAGFNGCKCGGSVRRLFKRQSARMQSYLDRMRSDVLWTCAFIQQRGKNNCAYTLVCFGLACSPMNWQTADFTEKLQISAHSDCAVYPHSFQTMRRTFGSQEWVENWQMRVPVSGCARW